MEIRPPWTDEQVERLNAYQAAGKMHPFSCPDREEPGHEIINGDLGTLTATNDGWVCTGCGYTQDWARESMADGTFE